MTVEIAKRCHENCGTTHSRHASRNCMDVLGHDANTCFCIIDNDTFTAYCSEACRAAGKPINPVPEKRN